MLQGSLSSMKLMVKKTNNSNPTGQMSETWVHIRIKQTKPQNHLSSVNHLVIEQNSIDIFRQVQAQLGIQKFRQITPITQVNPLPVCKLTSVLLLVHAIPLQDPVIPLWSGDRRAEPYLFVGRLLVENKCSYRGDGNIENAGLDWLGARVSKNLKSYLEWIVWSARRNGEKQRDRIGRMVVGHTLYSASTSEPSSCDFSSSWISTLK